MHDHANPLMPGFGAVPFTLKRSSDLWDAKKGYESRTETAHGLVRLEAGRMVFQWRLAVQTEVYGTTYETREEIEPVKEIVIRSRTSQAPSYHRGVGGIRPDRSS